LSKTVKLDVFLLRVQHSVTCERSYLLRERFI